MIDSFIAIGIAIRKNASEQTLFKPSATDVKAIDDDIKYKKNK